jgi:signal transduction histidine kinase
MRNTSDIIANYKRSEELQKYLSEASKILGSSLDYQVTLQTVAKLAIPRIADWCGIDILQDDGTLEQVAIAHKDPKMVKWAKEFRKANPPDMNASTGSPNIIRTGKSEFYPLVTDAMIIAAAKNKKQLALLRKLGFTSALTVPLKIPGKVVGVISFVTTESKRRLTDSDVNMAEELSIRAGLAINNALLYRTAQEAIQLRDDFISIASHELKTPVTSMKTYTQILQMALKRQGDEKNLRFLSKIEDQINKQTKLIEDLLNASKVQRGKLEFEITRFDINEVIKEITESMQATVSHKIHVKGRITHEISGDKDRIGQVIINLLSNAIKYSPKDDRIVVTLKEIKNASTVSVKDFGIGITEQQQKKIFDQFYQVNDPNEKTYPGLGIGLYISSEIIKRHGGELTVKSEKGKGSVFTFTLPEASDKLIQ